MGSFVKKTVEIPKDQLQTLAQAYQAYKGYFKFHADANNIYNYESKLKIIRIYFDTPTFDRITKDQAAKFVDMLSAIGGTMGLLTGFSVISGIEIIYFVVK